MFGTPSRPICRHCSERSKAGVAYEFLLWLALEGYAPTMEQFRVRTLAEAVHEVRKAIWKEKGKAVPPFEDTYFTVLLPALALLSMSATTGAVVKGTKGAGENEPLGPRRFRAWLGRLIHEHLQG